ncbi:MAG: pyruvate ferredoxin oxidoreductase [Candidatus Methanomethylicota archaeon]|uniref:Pyruvate ferredoxin oxidoreductase n=1 Tax=Thermoproteota archaeon TaxID=2056631 RepID=A0A497F1Z2_9CREN|nr:MAG: pyruvate ferredoxin oxidoreductase [Candidatus Verstraetearchaeota archaeon]
MVKLLTTGTFAIATAVKHADVDVISAYPIRPYTGVMNALARMIADGEFDAEYIVVDSEHTQFEVAKHAAACGARVFTGSAGIGWAYAHEPIVVTPGCRQPVVAMVGTRALDDPGNFGVEHNDVLAERDMGWMICFPENPQEAYDLTLMAYKIAENPKVLLPIAIACDGNFITHVRFPVDLPEADVAREFLPPTPPPRPSVLHPDKPIILCPHTDYYWGMEFRRQLDEAMRNAREVTREVHKEFNKIFGRGGPPFIEEIATEDAEVVLVGMGGMTMVARAAIREMRKEGIKVGFVKVRRFRPFPDEELREALKKYRAIGVIDNDFSLGAPNHGGILYQEVRSTLYDLEDGPYVINFMAGLGGREITVEYMRKMYDIVLKVARTGKVEQPVYWIGLRE